MAPLQIHFFSIGLYREHIIIFSSGAPGHRTLVLGIEYQKVDPSIRFDQIMPMLQYGPILGVTCFT